HRESNFEKEAEALGVKVKDVYWTVGSHDGLLILDSPDSETAAALMFELGSQGNVRTQLLRAFDRSEVKSLLQRIS
ncbi:MAG: GYD domain-containing protein, partial [Acidobacteriota bacterium]